MAAEARCEHPERATPDNWMYPPADGWTYDQVKELVLPCDWELLGGKIVVRGVNKWWHQVVRDELYYRLRGTKPESLMINSEQWVFFDEKNVPKPDIVLFDKNGLDVRTLDCIPVDRVVLAVEIVSPGSRSEDRFYKPALYAGAKIDHYWRIERGEDDLPVVHEYLRRQEEDRYTPRSERPTHTGTLKTDVPFPIEIDLRSLIEI